MIRNPINFVDKLKLYIVLIVDLELLLSKFGTIMQNTSNLCIKKIKPKNL